MASKKKVKVEVSRGKYVESLDLKKLGFKRVLKSFKFSFDGLKYAYTHEQSLALHVIVMALIIGCGFVFKITPIQWVITLVMGALILVAELFNTSLREEMTDKEKEQALNDTVRLVKRNSLDYISKNTTDIQVLQKAMQEKEKLKKLRITLWR